MASKLPRKSGSDDVLPPDAYPYKIERYLVAGEDPKEFDRLVTYVFQHFQPRNYIEHVAMTDFIYAQWELNRLRRLAPAAFIAARPFVVSKLNGVPEDRFCDSSFVLGDFDEDLNHLAAAGHNEDALNAQALLMFGSTFESFDKRAAVLEMRRDNAWDRLERWRTAQQTIDNVK